MIEKQAMLRDLGSCVDTFIEIVQQVCQKQVKVGGGAW
jgi:hypothetical protein